MAAHAGRLTRPDRRRVYIRTLLPGVSVGDWAEAEMIPAQLGILHPTGYPLYTLLVKAFTLLPFGSVAWRANLFSAVAAAAAVGVAVLIAIRLHVRPVIAFGALCAWRSPGRSGRRRPSPR